MNSILNDFDPDLYEKIHRDMDRYEIRGSQRIAIEEWVFKMTVAESLVSLLRKDLIDINGCVPINTDIEPPLKIEPTFVQSELGKQTLDETDVDND